MKIKKNKAHHQPADPQRAPEQQPLVQVSFPSAFYSEQDAILYGIIVWSIGVSCPGCGDVRWEAEKGLTLQELLIHNENIPVLSELLSSEI